jgi:endonuclease/exonuclease/phosphatase family metal-dependent hydrolase
MRRILIGIAVAALAVAAYVAAFLSVNHEAVAQARDVRRTPFANLPLAGETLEIFDWNLGYGGLGAGSDFFADGGAHTFPPSRRAVRDNVAGIERMLSQQQGADVVLLQELAHGGPVNYWVNLKARVDRALGGRERIFFADFQTRLMPWPLRMEHGQGIYARRRIDGVDAVALPAEDAGVFGVRRRYASVVARLPMEGGGGWTIASVHLAAFDEDALVRTRQLHNLLAWAEREYQSGRHVVLGGDWNFQIAETDFPHTTEERFLFWLFPFPQDALPQGWRIAADSAIPSVRTNHKPYVAGENYVTTIDGFIVSPNVSIESVNGFDLGFEHSDHQPVRVRVRAIREGTP